MTLKTSQLNFFFKYFLFSLQLEANNEQLECLAKDLELEKGKTDALLREVLPASVATQLINGDSVDAR